MSVSNRPIEQINVGNSEIPTTLPEQTSPQSDSTYVLRQLGAFEKSKVAELTASHRAKRISRRVDPIIKALKDNKPNEVILTCIELGAFYWNNQPENFNDFPDYQSKDLPPLDLIATIEMAKIMMCRDLEDIDIPENMFVFDVLSKGINIFTILIGRERVELILEDLSVPETVIINIAQMIHKYFPFPVSNFLMADSFIEIMEKDCRERQKYLFNLLQNQVATQGPYLSEAAMSYKAAEKLNELFTSTESNFIKKLEHAEDHYKTQGIKQNLLSITDPEIVKFCGRLDYYFEYLKKNRATTNLKFAPTLSALLKNKYQKSNTDEKAQVNKAASSSGLFDASDSLVMRNINKIVSFLKQRIEFFSAPFLNQEKFAEWAIHHKTIVNLSSELMSALNNNSMAIKPALLLFQEAILGEDEKNNGLVDGHEELIRNLLLNNSALRAALQRTMPHEEIEAWYKDHHVKACNKP